MSQVSAPHPPTLGRLGRYTIFEEMAEGGMARVFLAQRDGSSELCVLKQLLGELESHDTAAIRFQREAHIVSQLHHPNIARIVDAGLEDNKFCIAMELVDGVTLRQVLDEMDRRSQIMPPAITLAIGTQVLEGLAYAHALRDENGRHLSIVHRDLSPKNVMIQYDGSVKIIDFGVAQGRIDNFRTAPGMMVGTLHYMSPEQAMTEPIDHRSDLYTLSVVLYEMLTGRAAVRHGKAIEVLEQVVGSMPPMLREIDPGLPQAICGVVERGMQKEPGERWQTAVGFREALRQATHPIDTVRQDQIGAFVADILPPENHPARRWMERLQNHSMVDVPTLADDGLQTADVAELVQTISPENTPVPETTMPDSPVLPSISESVTRPDTPSPEKASLERMHELAKANQALKAVVARQRRMIRTLTVVLGIATMVWVWWLWQLRELL